MFKADQFDIIFIFWAFFLQLALIFHFTFRKKFFKSYTMKSGFWIYALCIPAAIISLILLINGKTWSFWVGGFLFVIYAAFGYWADYIKKIKWRKPVVLPIFIPYVVLYLSTLMFYWFPLALIDRSLWFYYAVLFVISTILNVTSH